MIYIFHFFGCKSSDELVNSTESLTKLNFFSENRWKTLNNNYWDFAFETREDKV